MLLELSPEKEVERKRGHHFFDGCTMRGQMDGQGRPRGLLLD